MAAGTMPQPAPNINRKTAASKPSDYWLRIPQKLSSFASASPIHTVVLISLLVSSAYVALLENSLRDPLVTRHAARASWPGPTRNLYAGPNTKWHWEEKGLGAEDVGDHCTLITLEFQGYSADIPIIHSDERLSVVPIEPLLQNIEFVPVPSRSYPAASPERRRFSIQYQATAQQKMGSQGSEQSAYNGLLGVIGNQWSELVFLFHHASWADVAMMAVAYISMHLTFASLFMSMYRLGSRVWLFTGVLLSSTFAFVFALVTVVKLGVPIDLALLSEGLPFLVVIIGFENPVRLTQAVLHNADRIPRVPDQGQIVVPSPFHTHIEQALADDALSIVKHYALEIAVLLSGALLGTDNPVREFCLLSACILFFDCILLFSFYTAILCIKLEITRTQTVDASSHPEPGSNLSASVTSIHRSRRTRTDIRSFKLAMVATLILVNVLNVSMIPFRMRTAGVDGAPRLSPWTLWSDSHLSPTLDGILDEARVNGRSTLIAVHEPIRLELQSLSPPDLRGDGDGILSDIGRSSLLRSLEDPVIVKGIVAALLVSLVLNGKLFTAARTRRGSRRIPPSNPHHLPSSTTPVSQEERPRKLDQSETQSVVVHSSILPALVRSDKECHQLLIEGRANELTDDEVVNLSLNGRLPLHALEKTLKDFTRAVKLRRSIISHTAVTADLTKDLERPELPYESYDWSRVFGVCCENVVGYMPVPVGFAGPLVIDGKSYFLPMATTEGVLVAGVMRGSKALNGGSGVKTVVTADGMTRGPCVTFESLERTAEAKEWLDSVAGQDVMKAAFDSTTRYGRLQSMKTALAGTNLYIRFKASTGDAMGMNMISKGVEHALNVMREHGFEDMDVVSLSANYCSDKKPAAINWVDGRGKSVVAQATIPAEIVRSVLKSDVDAMVALNMDKNLIGSAMAGSVGGFNAHAANIVAAMYIATGQDPAQVVESANCITIMKNVGGSLQISVSMPSIEVGTIGGGTTLGPQRAMLDVLGVGGANKEHPGENSRHLARIIAAATLAGELSLCAALAAGHLVKAHMQHNRAS
ncbi:uncharacterized protein DSM5745_06182 [Aspergillus mulundensis]|uniref:3-hydroxy-3-methylglutaryl coenzyme A reductase n=1 Tax=Aspergillus mulundensis TaxID=1810919 RepID=A0A3D8RZP3_9EURO|nr:Uncharacterized protein DSM5745_06182 [Aspergillus mulundensis]RDW79330.1 Uncharacterized protein DSM5745_06182 [Aspergillus mulundensis]